MVFLLAHLTLGTPSVNLRHLACRHSLAILLDGLLQLALVIGVDAAAMPTPRDRDIKLLLVGGWHGLTGLGDKDMIDRLALRAVRSGDIAMGDMPELLI